MSGPLGPNRLPRPHGHCDVCRHDYRGAMDARGTAGRAKGLLQRHLDGPLEERYRREAIDAVALADDAERLYVAHHADAHPEGPPASDVDFKDEQLRRAPTHRNPIPSGGELAALIRGGTTIADLMERFNRSESTVRSELSKAGFSSVTGQPVRRNPDGLPTLARLFKWPPWVADALCAQTDPEAFFPEKGGSTREAKAICARCPVAAECVDYALENGERFGIWGGLSERERRKVAAAMEPEGAA